MKKTNFIIALLSIITILGTSACNNTTNIKNSEVRTDTIVWRTFDQIAKLQKKQSRKIMVDVYTDWCGWCKKMNRTTYQHPQLIEFINRNYYAVKFNGESPETISFKNKEYKYITAGKKGYNELAAEWLGGRMSFPTLVILDENYNAIQAIPGYKDPQALDLVLNYFLNDKYKTTKWDAFAKSYQSKIKPLEPKPNPHK